MLEEAISPSCSSRPWSSAVLTSLSLNGAAAVSGPLKPMRPLCPCTLPNTLMGYGPPVLHPLLLCHQTQPLLPPRWLSSGPWAFVYISLIFSMPTSSYLISGQVTPKFLFENPQLVVPQKRANSSSDRAQAQPAWSLPSESTLITHWACCCLSRW